MRNLEDVFARQRVLVLGATGFIGSVAVKVLTAFGAEVFAVVRDGELVPQADNQRTRILTHDLRDLELDSMVREVRPALTLNLAGYGIARGETDPAEAQVINADLPVALAHALRAQVDAAWRGLSLVHVGSGFEYGTRIDDLHEDSEPEPETLYATTKLAGTLAVTEAGERSGLSLAVARPFTVYGPGEHAHRLLPTLLAARAHGEPVLLTAGTQRRDFIYVGDVVEALLRLGAADSLPAPVINVATGRLNTVREFVEAAAGVLGIARDRLSFGAIETVTQESDHQPVNVERLRAATGWTPRCTIAEGVARTVRELADSAVNEPG